MWRRTFVLWTEAIMRWRPVQVSHFDVCIIGGGPAGIAAALRAVDYNKRVCLIEANRIGGCDLWNGTLQSKTMWEMSNFLNKSNGSAAQRVYNTSLSGFMELDEDRMRQSLQLASETRERQITSALNAAKVEILFGRAFFTSPRELEVHNREKREYRTVTSDYFVIATGSSPREHPFVRVDHKRVVTSDDIMTMPLPRSMVIVGGGVLGTEFAAIFARLGRTKVFLLDKAERIMPKEDDDIAQCIHDSLEENGVTIHQDSVLYDMQSWEETIEEAAGREPNSGVQYTIMNRKTRALETQQVERALMALGREPNYRGLGLENALCKVRDGVLVVDDFGKCEGHDHIYAVGDAAKGMKLVNVGEAKGRLAVDRMFSVHTTEPLRYIYSRLIFLTIAVASVGANEQQCRQQNIAYVMAKYSYALCSRAVAANNTAGFVKILTSNDKRRTLLGVRVVGLNASTVIELAAAAIQRRQSAYELSELLTAYPSVSQAFLECLRVILGRSTMKPGTFPDLVRETWEPPLYERGRAYKPPLPEGPQGKMLSEKINPHAGTALQTSGEISPSQSSSGNVAQVACTTNGSSCSTSPLEEGMTSGSGNSSSTATERGHVPGSFFSFDR